MAISCFVNLINRKEDFIDDCIKVSEEINEKVVEIQNDKGLDLPLKQKIIHDRDRGKKLDYLHDIDPYFPIRNLEQIQKIMVNPDIAHSIHKSSRPDQPLKVSDKKEYLRYMEKTISNIKPFIVDGESELAADDVEEKNTSDLKPDYTKHSYDPEKSTLTIGGIPVKYQEITG